MIGIDGNEANVKNRVGSNVYAFQVLKNIYENREQRRENRGLRFKIFLKEGPLNDLPKKTTWWKYEVLKPKFLWTQWRLPLELCFQKEKPDVFFTPGHYAPRFCPVPLVISIMDLAFLRFPEQFKKNDLYQLINWTRYSVKKASHILTISEFTKREIIHFYNYPAKNITVTYPGIEIENLELRTKNIEVLRKYGIKDNYFLYIGTLQPRKNLIRLIEAFKNLITHHSSLITNLVIVGKKGWMYDEIFEKVKQLELEDKVVFTNYVSNEEKYILLKNAFAFILPSLYEGFGIPVLEAMQVGCPVIISKTSSLPEVADNAAFYINDPNSIDSIYQAMLKMVKLEDRERERLVEKGFNQVKKFSWEKCGEETLKILKKIGG